VLVLAGGLAMLVGLVCGAVLVGVAPWSAADAREREPIGGITATPGPVRALSAGPERPALPEVDAVAPAAEPVSVSLDHVLPDGLTLGDREAGLTSAAVPQVAGWDLVVVPGSEPAPHPERTVRTVRVEVEAGLDVDGARFAQAVMRILNDARGWGGDGSLSFARTDGDADVRVVLASPDKVDAMCAPLNTHGDYSCGRYGHAAINHTRWVQATDEFRRDFDVATYREYVITHEVGHLLGHQHVSCPGAGQRAPVMQQQSIRVAPCVANPWPFPDAPVP
jgi:hypothetical protein